MPLYHLLLDADLFDHRLRPALTAAWQRRSFEPFRSLCPDLAPAARAFRERYHTTPEEHLLFRLTADLPFDRALWRHLVGEVLWLAAAEIPELETAPASLACLVGAALLPSQEFDRCRLAPIQQAHYGSRELAFGAAFYRPAEAGYNDGADVARLADYLAGLDPSSWTPDALAALPDLPDEGDRVEELDFVREWLPALQDLYQQARRRGQLIVCEVVDGGR